MTAHLAQLTGSLGTMALVRPQDREPGPHQGTGFLVTGPTGACVVTAGHLALRFDAAGTAQLVAPSAASLCDRASTLPIATGQARLVPWNVAEAQDPSKDIMIFERVVTLRPMQPLVLAEREPFALERAFVLAELRGSPHRGSVHPATIVKVFEQGSLAVQLDGGLTAEEVQGCSGSPIVDAQGRVIGMVTTTTQFEGHQLLAGPSVGSLHRAFSRAYGIPTASPGFAPPPRPPGTPSALAVWLVALFVGGALAALVFFLHASYEYSPGYPRELRRFINQNEVPFLGGVTVVGMLAFAKLAYAKRWFTDGS